MKKLIAFFLSLLIAISLVPVATAKNIMTYTTTQTIVKGVTLTHVQEHHATYNLSYHYIVADLTEPHLNFEFLKNTDAIDRLENMSTLAQTKPNVITALNADFFSPVNGGLGFSTGIELVDGELLQNPIEPDKMATGIWSEDVLSFSYLEFSRTLEKVDGTTLPVRHTNKHTSWLADILLYTSNFNGGNSPAPGGTAIEIVVENDVVTDVRRGDVSVPIPENGYVLLTDEAMNTGLSDIEIGDTLSIQTTVSPNLEEATAAFGGGTLLVKDGSIAEFTHNITGYNPRSAIGTDESGTKIYLVAVDGRQEKSRGMTQTELANLMLSLGCYHAMNLDGGGSTRLLAASADSDYLAVANSPTQNRKVINAVGITSSAARSTPKRLEITPVQQKLLLGDTLSMEASVYDAYEHVLTDVTNIHFQLTGVDGKVNKNAITPYSAGSAQISATSGSLVSSEVSLEVVNSIAGITLADSISLEVGKSLLPSIQVFDRTNQLIPVHTLAPFDITYDSSILKIENGKLVGLKDGTSKLTLSYGDVSTTVSVTVGDGANTLRLEENVYQDIAVSQKDTGFVFRVGSMNEETDCLGVLTGNSMEELLSESDKAALLGAPLSRTANGKRIATNAFQITSTEDSLFISLDISQGSLRESDSAQWENFLNALDSSTSPNVFILFEGSLDEWNDTTDKKVFMDYLETKSAKRNFFVISQGDRNTLSASGGVRYFTLQDSTKGADVYDSVTSLQVLSFSINGDQVTYRWVPYYEQ